MTVNRAKRAAGWSGGYAEWVGDDTAYLSVAFTWLIGKARARAIWHRSLGRSVKAGGPALFHPRMKAEIEDVASIETSYEDAIRFHNPSATIASRGCPVGCWFCIVPVMEGTSFTLLPDFPVRPVLCDNNLSALPAKYQEHIIERYLAEGVPLLDANSGFEPRTFDGAVFERWRAINRGPWRFAYDDFTERADVQRVMKMLKNVPPKKTRVYVLIGNEPFADCMGRIREVIEWGGEPHVQPFIKLTALEKRPSVRFDWTEQKLRDVARWANGFLWKQMAFEDYDPKRKKLRAPKYDRQQGLFEDRGAARQEARGAL